MKAPSRYPRSITYLMMALALLGFLVAIIGSKALFSVYSVVYAAVFIAWGLLAFRGGR